MLNLIGGLVFAILQTIGLIISGIMTLCSVALAAILFIPGIILSLFVKDSKQ